MEKFYSIDRRGAYVEGERLNLLPGRDPDDNAVHAHINRMYPGGFSRHGVQYYRDPPAPDPTGANHNSGLLELLLEATRAAYYPEKPSRFQSVFAWETVDAALKFKALYAQAEHPIFELAPQARVHRGDMAIYALNQTIACIDHRLHLYWQGKTLEFPGHQPVWEAVLELPVFVGKTVTP